jgi:hypothetical protein
MKNPFHAFRKPVPFESSVEGPPVTSGVLEADPAVEPEVGEQTEMLTRARRRNRASGYAGFSVSSSAGRTR